MRIILITFLSLLFAGSLSAGMIDSEILKFEYHRFYFSNGSEALIIPGSKFEIFENDSPVCSGKIEKSFEGISISYPFDSTIEFNLKNIIAIIHTAEYDTTNPILIGYNDSYLKILLEHDFSYQKFDTISERQTIFDHKIISEFPDRNFASAFDRYDAFFSLNDILLPPEFKLTNKNNLGYLAVLMPNLSCTANKSGVLTTSLYYRYNSDLASLFFRGEIAPTNCLFPSDTTCIRSYQFDLSKGQRLSGQFLKSSPNLKISYNFPLLKETADFFADILSRDRFKVEVVFDDPAADLFINLLPYQKSNPDSSLIKILDDLKATIANNKEQRENLDIIKNRLLSAEQTDDLAMKNYFWQLVDYSLKYDLGVFPLFQPIVCYYFKNHITGIEIDQDGFISFDQLKKVKLDGEQ